MNSAIEGEQLDLDSLRMGTGQLLYAKGNANIVLNTGRQHFAEWAASAAASAFVWCAFQTTLVTYSDVS